MLAEKQQSTRLPAVGGFAEHRIGPKILNALSKQSQGVKKPSGLTEP